MSNNPSTEPFPAVAPPQQQQASLSAATAGAGAGANGTARAPARRRKSSNLGGEPRGDTGAAAMATLDSFAGAGTETKSSLRPHSKRRKAKSLLMRYVRLSLRHTWLNPLILVLLILALYAVNPTPSNPFHSCIFLSYPLPQTPEDMAAHVPVQYGKGKADSAFVAFYTIVLSFTREFTMQRVCRPLAVWCGITARGKQARFMEQAYTAIYFGIYGPFGLYVMSRTPVWYFNTTGMFEDFPHRSHEGLFKAYYLLQASYWAQQALVLVLMLEKPRKDFKELVLHHVVTLSLVWLSYRFHFTYMGIAVYITHDISDFFLATSKLLNYVDSPLTGPYFAFFILVWTYLRHYLNLHILWAVLTEFRTVGPFALDWATQQYKCWISQTITFTLLAALQGVNLFWYFLMWRIMCRFLITKVAADERSEDEDDDEDNEDVAVVVDRAVSNGKPTASGAAGVPGTEATTTTTTTRAQSRAVEKAKAMGMSNEMDVPSVTLNGEAMQRSGSEKEGVQTGSRTRRRG